MAYIYKITDKTNNKHYIGQAKMFLQDGECIVTPKAQIKWR